MAVAACTVIASAGLAVSQVATSSNKAVAARHAQMQVIGYHIGVLGAVAKGEMAYDSAMVDAAATNIATLATLQRPPMWTDGTEQGAADGSRAKAEIWSDPGGFADGFAVLEKAALAIVGAADSGAVGAGMGDLGGACKACHEKYRGPKN
tara:strand:+ start:2444 stop:2893 length:450 start_codon:yes stop_codon:yes gene_type:complete